MPGKTGKRRTKRFKRGTDPRQKERESRGRQTFGRESGDRGPSGYENSILRKYLEPDREREQELQRRKKEIMAARQARKEKNIKEMKELAASRVSYVKKPFAVRSKMSMILTVASLLLGGSGLYQAVTTQGQASVTYGAMGFCSIFLSVIAVWYGVISFWEDDKNYLLAKLGIGVSLLVLAAWTGIIIIGLRG